MYWADPFKAFLLFFLEKKNTENSYLIGNVYHHLKQQTMAFIFERLCRSNVGRDYISDGPSVDVNFQALNRLSS